MVFLFLLLSSCEICEDLSYDLTDYRLTITGYGVTSGDCLAPYSAVSAIVVGEGVLAFNTNALSFSGFSNLTSINFPSTLVKIGYNAFYTCNRLKDISLPDSLEELGAQSLAETGVTSLFLGSKLRFLGDSWWPALLESISVSEVNHYIASQDGVLFSNDMATILIYPPSRPDGSYAVPAGVTSIADYSAQYSLHLATITFPSSLRSLGNAAFWGGKALAGVSLPDSLETLGFGVFGNCPFTVQSISFGSHVSQIGGHWPSSITSFTVSPSNPFLASKSGIIFTKDFSNLILYPPGRPDSDFRVPENTIAIGGNAFCNCCNLVSVTMPYIIRIEDGIYSSVPGGTSGAFGGCTSLKTVEFGLPIARIGSGAFRFCNSLEFPLLWGLSAIGDYAFEDCYFTFVSFPETLVSIGEGAFSSCPKLTSVDLPDSLRDLPAFCFAFCSSLQSVRFPGGLRSIGSGCFNHTQLLSIVLPDSMKVIGRNALWVESNVDISMHGGASGVASDAFGFDSVGTLFLRGPSPSATLCLALNLSIRRILVQNGDKTICNGGLNVSGTWSPTPFPTLGRSPTPRNTESPSGKPEPPGTPTPGSKKTETWVIVGIVFGEIALVAIAVVVTYVVVTRRSLRNKDKELFSGLAK
jgi:hypothetical protein